MGRILRALTILLGALPALACLLAMLAVLVAGLVRADRVAGDPVASLASEGAAVTTEPSQRVRPTSGT